VPPSFTAHRSLYREIPYYRIFWCTTTLNTQL
jgi:hypothetical protein